MGRRPTHPDKVAIFRRLRRNRRPQLSSGVNLDGAPDNMIRFLRHRTALEFLGRHRAVVGEYEGTGAGSSPVLAVTLTDGV